MLIKSAKTFATCLALAALLASAPVVAGEASDKQPNILLILVDDMGWSDLGLIGGDIETPNLDRLAQEGLLFENFYNNAKCSQTRASLLSGLYFQQAIKDGPSGNLGHNQLARNNNTTLAEVLGEAGYFTALSGKWHLGSTPYERGFNRFYGFLDGSGTHWYSPRVFGDFEVPPDEFFSTDAYTDAGIHFIEQSLEEDKPFFLYLSYAAPHYPLHAHPEDIAKYKGRFSAGWEEVRNQRLKHMKKAGFIAQEFEIRPRLMEKQSWDTRDGGWDWDSLSDEEKAEQQRLMEVYAAMVDRLDQNIGRLLNRLQQLGLSEDTVVFFLSDNGGSPYSKQDDPSTQAGPPGGFRTLNTPWAQVNSAPFSLFKRYAHEGGIATPLIVSWPSGLQSPGRRSSWSGHVIDFMPTLLELAGHDYPESRYGDPLAPLLGESFVSVLSNRETPRQSTIYWDYADNYAVLQGNWKLVQSNLAGKWELYDLERDRGETHDLAEEQPERAAAMQADWEKWRNDVQKH